MCESMDEEFRSAYLDPDNPDLNDMFFLASTVPEPPHNFKLINEAILQVPGIHSDYGRLLGLGAVQILRENTPYPGDKGESDLE
jgi:hypothetical protein